MASMCFPVSSSVPALSSAIAQPENGGNRDFQFQGLLEIRPWASLLPNEGSHREVSLNYPAPHRHRATSILNSLLITPLYPAKAIKLTYLAIYPLRTNSNKSPCTSPRCQNPRCSSPMVQMKAPTGMIIPGAYSKSR